MKASISLALVGLLASSVLAGVSAHVYQANEITPLIWSDPNVPDIFQDIMVGTRLTIFIGSDTVIPYWSGGLSVSWEDWNKGVFSGRGYDDDNKSYDGSILPAAGDYAFISDHQSKAGRYLDSIVTHGTIGEWAVLDYRAEAVGTCHVGLYSYGTNEDRPHDLNGDFAELWPPSETFWIQGLTFNHVLSRDYNDNHVVDFTDFALFAGQWQGTAMVDPNATSSPDLNADGATDIADLTLFCDYWLERTDIEDPVSEPNTPGDGS